MAQNNTINWDKENKWYNLIQAVKEGRIVKKSTFKKDDGITYVTTYVIIKK